MAFRLTLLGPPQLLDGQGRLVPIPAKVFALVAFLLLTNGGAPASRASLRQFLWENSDAKTGATNLRKFLLRIRQRQKQFGFELVCEERDHVKLAQSVNIDLARFLQISAIQNPGDLVTLCDVYRSDLLEGHSLEEPEAREWLEVQRARLRDAFVSAVSNWTEAAGPATDKISLRVAARRLIEIEPFNESGHRALMRLFAEDGEPARVRDLYNSLEQRLRRELGVDPDPTTKQLVQALLPTWQVGTQVPEKALVPAAPASALMMPHDEGDTDVAPPVEFLEKSGTPRVTVLPSLPLVGQAYSHQLAISLIEDVTIGLCRSKSITVVAPHTAREMSQNGKESLLRSFKIDYAVETQLQNRGSELWLAVKLVNAVTRNILWVEQYEFDPSQMARQYRELSRRIVLLLVDTIERTELVRYDVEQDPTAYHLFLTGQRFLRTLDLPNIRKARRAFKLAINSSSDFVPALSGLAQTFNMEWLLMARGDSDLLVEAERLGQRALEIDPEDARGHRNMGLCRLFGGRFDESLEAFGRAEQRSPQHADLLVDFADALQHACEPKIALQKITHAIELNPLCPDWYWWVAGGVNFHLEQYGDSIACISHMRDKSPAFRLIAASWAMLGDRKKAGEYVRRAKDIHPDFNVNAWLSILPIRDPDFARRYEQGLREAGFS